MSSNGSSSRQTEVSAREGIRGRPVGEIPGPGKGGVKASPNRGKDIVRAGLDHPGDFSALPPHPPDTFATTCLLSSKFFQACTFSPLLLTSITPISLFLSDRLC